MNEFDELLSKWMNIKDQLDNLKQAERNLRMAIFNLKFENPIEGTNKAQLGNGWLLTATYPIDRKIDEAALDALRPQFNELKIPGDIIKLKYELSVKPYRTLTDDQRQIFDQALIIKPGSISLKVIPPKGDWI